MTGQPDAGTNEATGRGKFKVKALLMLLLGSVSLSWLLMTPMFGVADEAAYANYAYVTATAQGREAPQLPTYLSVAVAYLNCHAFHPEITATCQNEAGFQLEGDQLTPMDPKVLILGYPKPYFWLVGQASRVWVGLPALFTMRLVAWGLSMLLMGLMIFNWPAKHVRWLVLASLLASTPMVMSFSGAINPNGLEMVSGLSLAGLLAGFLLTSEDPLPPRHRALRLASIVIAMLALSTAKPWSFVFTLAITGAFLLASLLADYRPGTAKAQSGRLGLRSQDTIFLCASLLLSLIVGYVSNAEYRAAMTVSGTSEAVPALGSALTGIMSNFTGYALELIGILGWRDHAPPLWVLVIWSAGLVAFVVYAARLMNWRNRLVLTAFIVGTLLVVPVFSSRATALLGGAGFQARYVGALFCSIPLLAASLVHLSGHNLRQLAAQNLAPALVIWFLVLQMATLFWSFLRYSVGFPLRSWRIWGLLEWHPGHWPLLVITLVSAVTTAGFLRASLLGQTTQPEQSPPLHPGFRSIDPDGGASKVV